MLLSLDGVTKIYNGVPLFRQVSAKMEDHDRIALIGPNGVGKSTLLRLICGEERADEGSIALSRQKSVGILHQNSGLERDSTIWEEMQSVFAPLHAIKRRIEEIESLFADGQVPHGTAEYDALSQEYSEKSTYFEQKDGYLIDVKIKTVLGGMGFGAVSPDTVIRTLSGGEKTRLALAKLLLEEPDLLILDEPTNHLDFSTLLWLEDYLAGYRGGLLIVSHDRYFLDRTTEKTWELENGLLSVYKGNYTRFLLLKQEQYERRLKEYEEQQREIAKMQEYIDRNIVRASTTKMAQSRRNALEKMERIEKPYRFHKLPRIEFSYTVEPIKEVLRVSDMRLAVGEGAGYKLLASHLDLELQRGERLAIIGANGIGKSSFLKAIQKKIPYEQGRVEWGQNVRTAYFEQEMQMLNPQNTVLEELWQRHPEMTQQAIRTALGGVLLSGEEVYKKVGVLSGGERVKLSLAVLMLEHPNVLIMDEPTNHLDLYTKEVLEQALQNYTGTLILVSHDRYLLNKVPTRIMELQENGAQFFEGNFDAYREYQKENHAPSLPKQPTADSKPKNDYKGKARRSEEAKRRLQIRTLEQALETTEREIAELEQALTDPAVYQDYQKSAELCTMLEEKKVLYAEQFDEWAALSEG